MTKEEARKFLIDISYALGNMSVEYLTEKDGEKTREAIEALEQEPCEMTAEEYRQRMIQGFRNADCDELIALVVLPTEKEFEHLGWLLEKYYKAKPEPNRCNQCKYYEGVHNVQGHAPCSFLKCGGVLWDWHCSNYEPTGAERSE